MMINMRNKGSRSVLATVLAVFLASVWLVSCSPLGKNPGGPDGGGYERYYAGTAAARDREAFDQLAEDFFRRQAVQSGIDLHYTLADPEAYGITDNPLTLGEFNLEAMKDDSEYVKSVLKELKSINYQELSDTQKDDYKVLFAALETGLKSDGLELYAQPLSSTVGVQAQLPVLLAEYAFHDRRDVENYLSLLADIDRYYRELLAFEQLKSQAGLFMGDRAADHVLESCEAYLVQPDRSFLYETFNERVDGLADLTEEEKDAYKEQNLKVLEEHFIPAYKLLIDGITALMGTGTNEMGLCYYPQGKQYFEYLVEANTGTSYSSVKKLRQAIENQMNDDISAMSLVIKDHPEVLDHLADYKFSQSKPDEILNALRSQITSDFPELPAHTCAVKYVPTALEGSLSPAFYLVPAIDRVQDNVIYINNSPAYRDEGLYTTLAHEGYPGHLYQNVYFLSKNRSGLRKILSFPSYSEGWATYVEYASYTFDNGLDPDLAKVLARNSATTLGIYALLDIRINYEGWDREQASNYLKEVFSIENEDTLNSVYDALVENPTNYMEYYVGYLEIAQMRQTAEKVLGGRFDAKAFHSFLLDFGPAPFSLIQPEFQLWLEAQK